MKPSPEGTNAFHAIPLQKKSQDKTTSLIKQLLHHRQRRLEWLDAIGSSATANTNATNSRNLDASQHADSASYVLGNIHNWKLSKHKTKTRAKKTNTDFWKTLESQKPTTSRSSRTSTYTSTHTTETVPNTHHLHQHNWRQTAKQISPSTDRKLSNTGTSFISIPNVETSSITPNTNTNTNTIRLANCHLEAWSGQITIGGGPTATLQTVTLEISTSSSELWIPSVDCDAPECRANKGYNSSLSTTFSNNVPKMKKTPAASHAEYYGADVEFEYALDKENTFFALYPPPNAASLIGKHGMETIHLGDANSDVAPPLTITNQVFAQVLNFTELFFGDCTDNLGYLGLGLASYTPRGYPSLLTNLKSQAKTSSVAVPPVFGLYLDAAHDDEAGEDGINVEEAKWDTWVYDDDDWMMADDDDWDVDDDAVKAANVKDTVVPDASELVLGGVNQNHYEGCLNWHDVQSHVKTDEKGNAAPSEMWEFALADVQVGGESMMVVRDVTDFDDDFYTLDDDDHTRTRTLKKERPPASYALLDSSSSFLIGPTAGVGWYAFYNDAACLRYNNFGGSSIVDCLDDEGFDSAMMDCDRPLLSLDFVPYGSTTSSGDSDIVYSFEKDDLLILVDTDTVVSSGISEDIQFCLLRVMSSPSATGWVLGADFFNKYYAAFDYGNRRIGLAPAVELDDDICTDDLILLGNSGLNGVTNTKSASSNSQSSSSSHAGLWISFALIVTILNFGLLYRRKWKKKNLENIFDGGLELSDLDLDDDDGYGELALAEDVETMEPARMEII
mmetsp:Transcript_60640/g.72881  ORF Transcript_60640/g.72881 Transcript_60640/m.72881 type:complete len:787 (+) Transcript_60640:275-2635(+)